MHIGIDSGGTFTDLVCIERDAPIRVLKIPSTPDDPSRAVLSGLEKLLRDAAGSKRTAAQVQRIVHGTTVATNAVLERKGAKTGIITTRGFRDVLEIGRQIRTAVYDLKLEPQTPVFLAPGARRVEVDERVSAAGDVLQSLDETSVHSALQSLSDAGVESIAIVLLFAFLNPTHEQRIKTLAKQHFPHLVLSISSEVDPAFREYERTVVTAFDAYIKPVLTRYLQRIRDELRGLDINAPFQVMLSRGGIADAQIAMERPVRLFLSGPAAGVIGAANAGRAAECPDLLTVDIGGTSCDIALIANNKPLVRPEALIDGFPVRVPMVDVNAIGSGGGSIAWLDEEHGLHVGPHSAGASPGPACYGQDGSQPTVTDASLVLGLLNADNFAGGSIQLDIGAARDAIQAHIAKPLGLSIEQAALGIHRVLNAQMAEGMRLVSIEQGYDPRQFTLVALGGAGPLHAAALADELDIYQFLIPRFPGVLSASGLLVAPIEHEVAAGFPQDLNNVTPAAIRAKLALLDQQCAALMAREQLSAADICITHSADICYVGQSHYLDITLNMSEADPLQRAYADFIATHARVFGYSTDTPARIINLRSLHSAQVPALPEPKIELAKVGVPSNTSRKVLVDANAPAQAYDIYQRTNLQAGSIVCGPAIIEQADTTTVLPLGWRGEVVQLGHLLVKRTDSKTRRNDACIAQ